METLRLFILALGWGLLVAVQTRLVAEGKRPFILATWSFMTSITWALLIRRVVIAQEAPAALAYALGSAIGWTASVWLERLGDNGR